MPDEKNDIYGVVDELKANVRSLVQYVRRLIDIIENVLPDEEYLRELAEKKRARLSQTSSGGSKAEKGQQQETSESQQASLIQPSQAVEYPAETAQSQPSEMESREQRGLEEKTRQSSSSSSNQQHTSSQSSGRKGSQSRVQHGQHPSTKPSNEEKLLDEIKKLEAERDKLAELVKQKQAEVAILRAERDKLAEEYFQLKQKLMNMSTLEEHGYKVKAIINVKGAASKLGAIRNPGWRQSVWREPREWIVLHAS